MRATSTISKIVGLLVGIILLGMGLGWLAGRDKSHPAEKPAEELEENSLPTTVEPNAQPPHTQRENPTQIGGQSKKVSEVQPLSASESRGWQNKISTILGADADEVGKRKELLNLFPQLPEAGQVEATKHLINLVSDVDYALLQKILTDTNTPAEVSEILLHDLLNRVNSLKVPLILEVARNPNQPTAGEARELLERLLLENHGTNWTQWERAAREWLKQNPD